MRELRELIEKIVDEKVMVATIAKVKSVNKSALTCVVEVTGTDEEHLDVRLLGVSDEVEKPTVYFPKVGSFVGIMPLFNSRNMMAVFLVTEIDEVLLNGDEFGGLVKVNVLVDRLNKLEARFNDFKAKYNSHVHAGVTTGVGSSGTTPTTIALANLVETQVEDIENEKIKHG